jgi:phosphoserine phosphatase RsbX
MIEWAVSTEALNNLAHSGDHYIVKPLADGVLVGVVDGLGHGQNAEVAALTAVECLQISTSESITTWMKQCHDELLKTRGAVISLAHFRASTLTLEWIGVGNVEGVFARAPLYGQHERLMLRGGVVGYRLPTLRVTSTRLSAGDTLILATDGIRSHFTEKLNLKLTPQQIADGILRDYARKTDDALVLVARCV